MDTPEPLLWIHVGAPGAGHNKPEGLDLERRHGNGCCTLLDVFVLLQEVS